MTGEGNGNPLQYSCLENPVDRGAWWAAVHGVTQSRTRLKRLSLAGHGGGALINGINSYKRGLRELSFSSPVATAEFSKFPGILSVAFSQHHL